MLRLAPLLIVLALVATPAVAQSVLPPLPAPEPATATDFDARVEQALNGAGIDQTIATPSRAAGETPTLDVPAASDAPAIVPLEDAVILPPPDPSAEFQVGKLALFDPSDDDSTGGEIRWRYFNERARLRAGNPFERNTYQQWRVLLDAAIGTEIFDFKATYIDAANFGEELPRTTWDENRSDLLQLYGDLLLNSDGDSQTRVRVGRQMLDYGSQRMVSRLDWANMLRNFEGGRFYSRSGTSSLEAFVTRPVNAAAGSPDRPRSFDHSDQSTLFSGLFASTSALGLGAFDLYWYYLDETEPQLDRLDGSIHTIGGRWNLELPTNAFSKSAWLLELEGAGQFGRDNFVAGGSGQDVSAGAFSAVGGGRLGGDDMTLTVTGFCWVGSGDKNANDGQINSWHILYPDSHRYWGLIDNVSGSNLTDLGLEAKLVPASDLAFDIQWHRFHKTRNGDFVYDVQGFPIAGSSTTPGDIGSELDLSLILGKDPDGTVQVGYFWFWYGDAINANPALARPDAGQFYVSVSSRF